MSRVKKRYLMIGALFAGVLGATAQAGDDGGAQAHRGLVEYKGQWLKPEDAALRQQQDRLNEELAPGRPHEVDNLRHQGVPTVLPAAPAPAPVVPETPAPDTVELTNGNEMQGVVVKKSKTELRLKIGADSYVDLELSTVARIKRGDLKAERTKLAEWKIQEQEEKKRAEVDAKFAAEKEANGFHYYDGKWLNEVEYNTALFHYDPHQSAPRVFMATEGSEISAPTAPASTYERRYGRRR